MGVTWSYPNLGNNIVGKTEMLASGSRYCDRSNARMPRYKRGEKIQDSQFVLDLGVEMVELFWPQRYLRYVPASSNAGRSASCEALGFKVSAGRGYHSGAARRP